MTGPTPATPRPGALLLHGLTATTESVRGLADALDAVGFRTVVPLLPGHGTTVEDLERCHWADWVATASTAYRDLAARCDRVVVVGFSLGASLGCWLATEPASRAPAGLVVVNPSIDPPAETYRDALRLAVASGIRSFPNFVAGAAHPAQGVTYDEVPLQPLLSFYEGLDALLPRLGRVACPVLIMTSRKDPVVPPVSSDILAERVAGPVERVRLNRDHHVATLDYDPAAMQRTVEFARAVTGDPAYR